MGYTIVIGEAVPDFTEDGTDGLRVEKLHEYNAPFFVGGGMQQDFGAFSASYTWTDACLENTLLKEWFFTNFPNAQRSWIVRLTEDDWQTVNYALERYKAHTDWAPGFSTPQHDGWLAFLFWLDFWIRAALDHCKNPAMFVG